MRPTGRVGVGVIGAGVISGQYLDELTTFPDPSGTVEGLLTHPEIEIAVNLTIPTAHVEVAR